MTTFRATHSKGKSQMPKEPKSYTQSAAWVKTEAAKIGVSARTVEKRLERGWSVERVISTRSHHRGAAAGRLLPSRKPVQELPPWASVSEALIKLVGAYVLPGMDAATVRAARDRGKKLAYGVLAEYGARRVLDLAPAKYTSVVAAANVAINNARFHAAFDKVDAVQKPNLNFLYDLHFLLRAIGSILGCDPNLVLIGEQVRTNEPSQGVVEEHEALVHERGRKAAVSLLKVARPLLYDTMVGRKIPYAAVQLMRRLLTAVAAALDESGYDYRRRYTAAANVRIALDVWSGVISGAL